jgi:Uma2 family endonuclease
MIQPDIIIVCDEDKIKDRVIYGAPDFVLEILSPSTRRKDMFVKSGKYCEAGVKEYWMVDPKTKTLIVYNFMDDDVIPIKVPLEGEYPLFMYDGKLKINLTEIAESIDRFG